jgi:DNA-binding GntR family transcriptional regulator
MPNERIEQLTVRAVQQAYDAWAAEHPNLAGVIDRITVTEQTAQSLRASADYRQAVADFHRGMAEADLLNHLIDLVSPLLTALLQP